MKRQSMTVSGRFVALAAAGLLLICAAWLAGLHTYMFVLYNLVLIGLLLLDYFLSPNPEVLRVTRADNDKLYYKTDNEIAFFIYNTSRYQLHVQACDEISSRHFTVTGQKLVSLLSPGKTEKFSYMVLPAKRGSFVFQQIHLRYKGLLGLCVKQTAAECPIEFRVYPNLKDLSKYRLMIQKNRLLPQGEKTVKILGTGAEFESLRTYVEGDDYRKINWMATARENRLMVNHYQAEKNQPVMILLDAGRPMSYDIGGYKKLDYAVNAALILSDIVNQQGDNSGLMVFDTQVHTQIMPGKGAAHRNQMMEALYHMEENRLTSDYEEAFRKLCERQKRRSLVFIFTDFEMLDEAESLIAHIALLKRRHVPIVVFMKNEGLLTLATQPVFGRKDQVLRDTATEFLEERKKIFRTLNAMRIPNVESAAESFATAAVNSYLMRI